MSAAFDPYHEWLDIPPEEQPADFYRLLGLARFEDDLGRIAAAVDERMARIRSYQTGPRGAFTQKILNELAAARVRLLDPASKAEYDRELAQRLARIEAARRGQAAQAMAEPPPVAASPPPPTPPPLSRAANWQRPLLIGSLVTAVVISVSGWALHEYLSATGKNAASAPPKAKKTQKPASRAADELPLVLADTSRTLHCRPQDAVVAGDVETVPGARGEALGGWSSLDSEARWTLDVTRAGFYEAEITYAATSAAEDAVLEIRVGERTRTLSLRPSGGPDTFHSDTLTVAIERSGRQVLAIRPRKANPGDWLLVQSVRLVPVGADVRP